MANPWSKRILSALLSVQIPLSSLLAYWPTSLLVYASPASVTAAPGPQDPDKAKLEEVARDLESGKAQSNVDTFHLTNQISTINQKGWAEPRVFNLNDNDLSMPNVAVGDFESDVEIGKAADGSLLLTFTKNKKPYATHNIPSLKVSAIARDKEILIVIDEKGKLNAIDLGYARLKAFTSPIPVFPLVQSNLTQEEIADVKATFISRGVKPMQRSKNPSHIFPEDKTIFAAGDIALYTESNGVRTMVGEFDRDVVRTQLYTGEALLAMTAFELSPPDDASLVATGMSKLIKNTQAESLTLALTEDERGAVSSVSIQNLIGRAAANAGKQARDQFGINEWIDSENRLLAKARATKGRDHDSKQIREAAENGELGPLYQKMIEREQKAGIEAALDPRPLWYNMLSGAKNSPALKLMAKALAVGLALKGGEMAIGTHVVDNAAMEGIRYATSLVGKVYDAYWPQVLKDSVYRVTLLKSSLALGSFVPLTYFLGALLNKKSHLGVWRSLAAATLRIYAEMSLMFYHRLAGAIHQPNFLRALREGINPFANVSPDSVVGQALGLEENSRIGVSNPLKSLKQAREDAANARAALRERPSVLKALGSVANPLQSKSDRQENVAKLKDVVSQQRDAVKAIGTLVSPLKSRAELNAKEVGQAKVVAALAEQKKRVKSLAWTIALQTAASEADMDPATLAANLSDKGESYARESIAKVADSDDFKKQWSQLATELEIEFSKIAKNEYIEDITKIDPADLGTYFGVARAKAKEIQQRDLGGRVLAGLKTRWMNLAPSVAKSIANWGLTEYDFMKNAIPNDFVTGQFWRQYLVDYFLAIAQMGTIGARADFNDPKMLAADPNEFLWTNGGHRYDMVDQVRAYVIGLPASLVLAYQDPKAVHEEGYLPVESFSMKGIEQSEGYLSGLKSLLKLAFDPKRADEYGKVVLRQQVKGFKTIQFRLIAALFGRIVVGGQSFGKALGSFAYFMMYAQWGYGWTWDAPNQGSKRYGEKFEERNAAFTEAKAKMARGLRLNDADLIVEGSKSIAELYAKADSESDGTKLMNTLVEKIGALTSNDLNELRSNAVGVGAVDDLQRAILGGGPQDLAAAHHSLEARYRSMGLNEDATAIAQLTSLNALRYALMNPPFDTKANGKVLLTATLWGAVTSTYLGTIMAVYTFREGVNWMSVLGSTAIESGLLYASYFYGTKGISKYARKRETVKAELTAKAAPGEKIGRFAPDRAMLAQAVEKAKAYLASKGLKRGVDYKMGVPANAVGAFPTLRKIPMSCKAVFTAM